MADIYFAQRSISGMLEIWYDLDDQKYHLHILLISMSRLIISVIFLCGIYLIQLNQLFEPYFHESISVLFWPEWHMFIMNAACSMFSLIPNIHKKEKLSEIKKSCKNTLRFYIARRNLLFFRILILSAIIFFLTWVAIVLKGFTVQDFRDNRLSYLFTIAGAVYLAFSLHTYGKIVIIAATASHDWIQDNKEISFKDLLSAITLISKYHLGSVFINAMGISFYIVAALMEKLLYFGDKEQCFMTTYSVPYIIELSKMFTAVFGVNITSAIKNVDNLEKRCQPPLTLKSEPSVAWRVTFKLSSSITFLVGVSGYAMLLQPSLLTLIPLLVYFGITSVIYYTITALDTIEQTIEFCKIDMEQIVENHELFEYQPRNRMWEIDETEMSRHEDLFM